MVCQLQRIKVPNRNTVMNLDSPVFAATLASAIRFCHGLTLGFPPSDTIRGLRCSALPSRVGITNKEFRLPLGHATVVAKDLHSVKVGSRARNVFATPVARLGDLVAAARVAASVLRLFGAFPRAVFLIPPARTDARFPTDSAPRPLGFWAPTGKQITLTGTIPRLRTTVVGMERLAARVTQSGFSCLSHGPQHTKFRRVVQGTIEIQEKYCAIAAQRLRQEVLPLRD